MKGDIKDYVLDAREATRTTPSREAPVVWAVVHLDEPFGHLLTPVVNLPGRSGITPAHAAACHRKWTWYRTILALLQYVPPGNRAADGLDRVLVDICRADENGWTILHYAVWADYQEDLFRITTVQSAANSHPLADGGDVGPAWDFLDTASDFGEDAASSGRWVQALLDKSQSAVATMAQMREKKFGLTPLSLGTALNSLSAIRLLAPHLVLSMDTVDHHLRSALHHVRSIEALQILCNNIGEGSERELRRPDQFGCLPCVYALEAPPDEILELFRCWIEYLRSGTNPRREGPIFGKDMTTSLMTKAKEIVEDQPEKAARILAAVELVLVDFYVGPVPCASLEAPTREAVEHAPPAARTRASARRNGTIHKCDSPAVQTSTISVADDTQEVSPAPEVAKKRSTRKSTAVTKEEDVPSIATPRKSKAASRKSKGWNQEENAIPRDPSACTYPGCNVRVEDGDELVAHFIEHAIPVLGNDGFDCPWPSCNAHYKTQKFGTEHFASHGPRPHRCALCGKSFAFSRLLALHLREAKHEALAAGSSTDAVPSSAPKRSHRGVDSPAQAPRKRTCLSTAATAEITEDEYLDHMAANAAARKNRRAKHLAMPDHSDSSTDAEYYRPNEVVPRPTSGTGPPGQINDVFVSKGLEMFLNCKALPLNPSDGPQFFEGHLMEPAEELITPELLRRLEVAEYRNRKAQLPDRPSRAACRVRRFMVSSHVFFHVDTSTEAVEKVSRGDIIAYEDGIPIFMQSGMLVTVPSEDRGRWNRNSQKMETWVIYDRESFEITIEELSALSSGHVAQTNECESLQASEDDAPPVEFTESKSSPYIMAAAKKTPSAKRVYTRRSSRVKSSTAKPPEVESVDPFAHEESHGRLEKSAAALSEETQTQQRRSRGRPRKNPLSTNKVVSGAPQEVPTRNSDVLVPSEISQVQAKRSRGRPKKNPSPSQPSQPSQGFDNREEDRDTKDIVPPKSMRHVETLAGVQRLPDLDLMVTDLPAARRAESTRRKRDCAAPSLMFEALAGADTHEEVNPGSAADDEASAEFVAAFVEPVTDVDTSSEEEEEFLAPKAKAAPLTEPLSQEVVAGLLLALRK